MQDLTPGTSERRMSVLITEGIKLIRQVPYIWIDFSLSVAAGSSSFRLKAILESVGITAQIERSGRPE
jgi:hypothetical protein